MRIAPGSLWLAYTVTQPRAVQKLLPDSLELTSSKLLTTGAPFPSPQLLFNLYAVGSKWMKGMRADVLTLAKHRQTQKTHLVVLDCLTNTLQWDPVGGVRGANAHFFRPVRRGAEDYSVGIKKGKKILMLKAKRLEMQPIDWTFAVEANMACYFQDIDVPYTMNFSEHDIMLPVRGLQATECTNTFWKDVRSQKLSNAFMHEHAMEFDVSVASFLLDGK